MKSFHLMKHLYSLIVFQLLYITTIFAQPANNDCNTATNIPDVADYCSAVGEYTNVNATASNVNDAPCFSNNGNDVWFSFTTIALDVTITIIGDASPASGGTLRQPEVALYTGSCDANGFNLQTLQCGTDDGAFNNHFIQITRGGLEIGQTYFIRVRGRSNREGTFQLCLNNFNPPVNPGSDCVTSAVLCDKSSFVVQQVIGAGNDPDELGNSSCLGGLGGNSESSSTWFTWTAETSGSLTFTLNPLNPSDDLDFVVYELPGGIDDCANKTELRCMASGDFNFPSRCMGATGLNEESTDVSEPPGCNNSSQDNFLAALDMQAGTSYALVINNFTNTGSGFEIDFGGTGEFVGPQAAFTTDPSDATVCVGSAISFTDASSFALGSIVDWEWSFGSEASPSTATGPGPHEVVFQTPGLKPIVLTVTSDEGCIVTEIETITARCCEINLDIDALVQDVRCTDDANGSIDLTVSNPFPPYAFQWNNGETTEDISDLTEGDYSVTITDEASCDTVINFTINSPPPIELNPVIGMPTCDGGTDGSIELQAMGGTPPYTYSWEGAAFSDDNTLNNISQGDYTVVIRDMNDCEETLDIEVRELQLELDPNVQAITPPSCFGFSDGSIVLNISNGLAPFQYDFNDGNGFVDGNSLMNLPSGTYSVDVIDANLCEGHFDFLVEDPLALAVDISVTNVACFGQGDGMATANVSGGVGNYSYQWSNGQTGPTATGLMPGTYSLTVLDGNACEITDEADVIEPGLLNAEIVNIADVFCFGEATGSLTASGMGGNPPYQYSLDGVVFQSNPQFTALFAGNYTVFVQDQRDCIATVDATIIEPDQLVVDLGTDLTLLLGCDIQLDAQISPPDHVVTYEWFPSDSLECVDCPSTKAKPTSTTTYEVVVTDPTGCAASDQITITVSKERPLFFPNAFSPDGDGINDYFTIYGGKSARIIKMLRVFDRWGALLFEATDIPLSKPDSGWDGTFRAQQLGTGVYAWFAQVEFVDGEVFLYEGDVTIMK